MIEHLSKLSPRILVDSVIAYANYKVDVNFIGSDRWKKMALIISDTHVAILKYRAKI